MHWVLKAWTVLAIQLYLTHPAWPTQCNLKSAMPRPFQLVDVFNDGPFSGNPLGVVAAAGDLTAEDMQRITR